MKPIANFFWQGTLSLYEYMCIKSFVKNNFEVIVWSYQHLDLPLGAKLADAKEIVPYDLLYAYSQGGKDVPSLAAFSDVFRFTLLSKKIGWWFDTDCFCLKSADEFTKLAANKDIVAGMESQYPLHIACGVIHFKNVDISMLYYNELINRCKQYNNNFPNWGDIGPKLFTKVTVDNSLTTFVSQPVDFYSIHYKETDLILKKEYLEIAREKTKTSFVCHLWNEILRKKAVDKSVMPEDGSYLNYLFSKNESICNTQT